MCLSAAYAFSDEKPKKKGTSYGPEVSRIKKYFDETEIPSIGGASFSAGRRSEKSYSVPCDFQFHKKKTRDLDVKKNDTVSVVGYRIDTAFMDMLYLFPNIKTLTIAFCTFVGDTKCDWSRFRNLESLSLES